MTGQTKNRVLLSLDAAAREAVLARSERVDLAAGSVLARTGERTSAALFPETAVISTLADFRDGTTVDMANVGREACSGLNLVLGNGTQFGTDEIQIGGIARRLPADRLPALMEQHTGLERALRCTVQAIVYQVMVSGACNATHDARQRLARWLLTMDDRSDAAEMRLTHEFLAHMLGVRRATVTEAASGLRAEGLIAYAHGRVTISDRAGLHAASCGCYDLVREAYDVLLPEKSAASA